MSAPSLDVLRIQAEHIRQQATTLRTHIETHEAGAVGANHLHRAVAYCASIELLASFVDACITCAIEAQKPLPVCANDKPGGAA